jgi:hypothetical protein
MKLPELNSFDDREAKALNVARHIGRRPLLTFGNSDGDLPMMRYAKSGSGPRLALLLHHDDAKREAAYDREFRLSPLSEALDKTGEFGITVGSVKLDWRLFFDQRCSSGGPLPAAQTPLGIIAPQCPLPADTGRSAAGLYVRNPARSCRPA